MEHVLQTRTQWMLNIDFSIGRTYSLSSWNYPILNVHKKTEFKAIEFLLKSNIYCISNAPLSLLFVTSAAVNYLMLDALFLLWLKYCYSLI